jgi:hypothetical protein
VSLVQGLEGFDFDQQAMINEQINTKGIFKAETFELDADRH